MQLLDLIQGLINHTLGLTIADFNLTCFQRLEEVGLLELSLQVLNAHAIHAIVAALVSSLRSRFIDGLLAE